MDAAFDGAENARDLVTHHETAATSHSLPQKSSAKASPSVSSANVSPVSPVQLG